MVSWGGKNAKKQPVVFGEGIVDGRGGIFVAEKLVWFFSGKGKPENGGGEGPVIGIFFSVIAFWIVSWANQSFVCAGISRTWLKYS